MIQLWNKDQEEFQMECNCPELELTTQKNNFHVEKDFSPKIHDDGTLEKGGNIEDAQQKSVEDLVHLFLQYEFSFLSEYYASMNYQLYL